MSDRSERASHSEDVSWPDSSSGDRGWEGDGGEAIDSTRHPAHALARAEAALAAARNEIALLRARVARLSEDNERLEDALRSRS